MENIFNKNDYENMYYLVFRSSYAGYSPTTMEIPNGDGKVDAGKRYAHISLKNIRTAEEYRTLMPFLIRAHVQAMEIAEAIRIAPEFMPKLEYCALRILDYPPGTISNRHEDFDLFTLMCYRDQPDRFMIDPIELMTKDRTTLYKIHQLNPQAHIGQLGTEIGMGPASPHQVLPSETRQSSIVYFAIPDHKAVLPNGIIVKDWLNERMARSRTQFKEYE